MHFWNIFRHKFWNFFWSGPTIVAPLWVQCVYWSAQKKFWIHYWIPPKFSRTRHFFKHFSTTGNIVPPPFVKGEGGGDWIFELNKIWGQLRFFKIKGVRKRGCRGEFLKFSLGGKLLEMKLQTENKFQNEICTSLVGFLTSVF